MKKRLLALLLAAVMATGLTACQNGSDSSAAGESSAAGSDKELTEITFALDWTPNTNHTGVFVADALGYYEEVGLKVNIVQASEDGATTMVASNQAQFGVDFQEYLASAFNQDIPVTAVAALI